MRATPSLLAPANQKLAEWRYRVCTTMAVRYDRPIQDEDIQLLAGLTSAVLTSATTAWVDSDVTTLAAEVDRAADRARTLLGRDDR